MAENEFGNGYGGPGGYQTGAGKASVSFGDQATPEPKIEPGRDITTAQFKTEVIDASNQLPVLVDFWAPWCGPCKQLAPLLEKLVAETQGKLRLVKMNIEEHPEVSNQMGIQSIPAVVAFVDGKPAEAFMGAKPESEIRAFIEKLVGPSGPSEAELMLEEAGRLAEQGAQGDAANLYGAILQGEPQNVKALAGLGHIYLAGGDRQAVEALINTVDEANLETPEIISLTSALELEKQAEDVGDLAELQALVDKDANNYQARLDLGIALNAAGKREEAADQLLEIIAKKPDWNEQAAKQQLLQFFEAWGMSDAATLAARRRLSALLFS